MASQSCGGRTRTPDCCGVATLCMTASEPRLYWGSQRVFGNAMRTLSIPNSHTPGCGCCGGSSRREFLLGAAAIGAAAVLQTRQAKAQQKTLVDTHHHFYPPEYQKLWLDWEDARKLPHFPGQVV